MMKLTKLSTIAAACALLSVPTVAQQGGNGGTGGAGGNAKIIAYIDTLPLEAIDGFEFGELIKMRQEEKLARDVYLTLGAKWGTSVFSNIAAAEQEHMDLLLYMFDRYGFADPLMTDEIGVFPDQAFTSLYKRLVAFGSKSSTTALRVGALIEDLDIFDLDLALAGTDNRDLMTVWQNLARGSRNHMRSFYDLLLKDGVRYYGVWLPTPRILAIVNSPSENAAVDEDGVVLP